MKDGFDCRCRLDTPITLASMIVGAQNKINLDDKILSKDNFPLLILELLKPVTSFQD